MFQQFSQTNVSVLVLTGLMERFYCIPTSRTLSEKFWFFRVAKLKIELYLVL